MKKVLLLVALVSLTSLTAQNNPVTTQHSVNVNGQNIKYIAEVGTLPLKNEVEKEIASIQYTYYKKSNSKKETRERPLLVSFNGGPGSGSVWMHLAYTGPRVLKISDEGFPVQPFGYKTNPHSVLDVADIVYVNPVNTGYSRPVRDEDGKFDKSKFFGVNEDVNYLAQWLNQFVTKKDKWLAPKFLIGESYGTTRVSGLAHALQNQYWMYLNGVILVSPTELGIDISGPVEIANRLPYFAAAAWYHDKLDQKYLDMTILDYLDQVEDFTINKLTPALLKGGFLEENIKENMAQKMSEYAGIDKNIFVENNLNVSYNLFWKSIKKEDGFTVGRLDSRYLGLDERAAGERPDYNAELTSWLQAFTPAINAYYKNELNYDTDLKYNMFGSVYPWNRKNNRTGKQLRQAMAQNPSLNVMIQSGLYDGATTYFNAKYVMRHIDASGRLQDRFDFKTYESGHMMYLRKADLKTANNDIREFILKSIPEDGKPIKY